MGDPAEQVVLLTVLSEPVLGVNVQDAGGLRHRDVLHQTVPEVDRIRRVASLLVKDRAQDLLVRFEHPVGDVSVLGSAQAVAGLVVVPGAQVGAVDTGGQVVVRGGIEDVDDSVQAGVPDAPLGPIGAGLGVGGDAHAGVLQCAQGVTHA